MFPRKTANGPDGQGGQIAIQLATSELPEWLKSALYRGAAKGGLTETDPLWGCLVANGELLRAYLDAEAGGTKKSLAELTQEVQKLARAVQYLKSPETRPENVAKRWGIILAIAAMIFGAGYCVCWSNMHMALEQRMARVINAQPAASRVPLWLAAHGGSISIGVIKSADGKSEQQGIIIEPGALKFAQPTFSLEGGSALVPIE